MQQRIVWSAVFAASLVAVGLAVCAAWAQEERRPQQQVQQQPRIGFVAPTPVGRFTVARATELEIVVLDTATGKLYKASAGDLEKFSAMPKVDMPRGPERFTPPQKDRGRGEEKRREEKDGDRKRGEEEKRREEKRDDRKPGENERGQKQDEAARERELRALIERKEREMQELKSLLEREKGRRDGQKESGEGTRRDGVKPPPLPGTRS